MIKVQIIHEQKNESWLESVGVEPEVVQILEDGVINEKDIVAISAFYENTQLFLQGGHILMIEENYYSFVRKWMQLTQPTTNREI